MEPTAACIRGLATALFLFVPAAVLNLIVTGGGDGTASPFIASIFYVFILLGAGAGGWATIRLSTDAPLWYASAAPLGAYVIVQGFGVIRRLIGSGDLRWGAYIFQALLIATCGMLGGMFARRLVTRSMGNGSDDGDRHSTSKGDR